MARTNDTRQRKPAMTTSYKWIALCLLLLYLAIYAFVTAPPPLLEAATNNSTVSIKRVLEILEHENDTVRTLYTKSIVGAGKKQGIAFDEDWADADTQAGLLPAQFLRETARFMEQDPLPLGLFLGSDNPINTANGFSGEQLIMFEQVKHHKQPKFQFDPSIKRYSYMFPDIAVTRACVSCHNEHDDTPKTDWKLNDIMGATTWTYPDQRISIDTALQIVLTLRQGFRTAYELTLTEAREMKKPPVIGKRWPNDGRFLPSADVFMQEFGRQVSATTLEAILLENTKGKTGEES